MTDGSSCSRPGWSSPWLLRRVMRAPHRDSVVVAIDAVERLEPGRVHLAVDVG